MSYVTNSNLVIIKRQNTVALKNWISHTYIAILYVRQYFCIQPQYNPGFARRIGPICQILDKFTELGKYSPEDSPGEFSGKLCQANLASININVPVQVTVLMKDICGTQ